MKKRKFNGSAGECSRCRRFGRYKLLKDYRCIIRESDFENYQVVRCVRFLWCHHCQLMFEHTTEILEGKAENARV